MSTSYTFASCGGILGYLPVYWVTCQPRLLKYLDLQKKNRILNLNSVNQLISVMVKCGVLFEVRTEFLNNI
jgi:hypothetical protein